MATLNGKNILNLKNPLTCSHWEEQNYRVLLKIFCFAKDPFTHLDKGCRNAHPFLGFFSKIFWEKILPFTYLELQSQMTPYFTEKWENIFSVAGALFCLPKKVPSLIPTENGQMHPLISKKFIPSLIWNWEVETHPVFTKNLKNIFCSVVGQLIFACLKSPFTYLELECQNATCFREKFLKKNKKICPPEVASKEF